MSKKNKFDKVKSYSSDSDEMVRMIKILGGVILIFIIFYFVFAVINGDFSKKEEYKPAGIQNVEILAGTTFSRSDSEYYVLMYNFEGEEASKYSALYNLYINNIGRYKIYLVDLNNALNKNYVVEDAKKVNISDIASLKVVDGTIIKVSNNIGTSYKTGLENIEKELFDN